MSIQRKLAPSSMKHHVRNLEHFKTTERSLLKIAQKQHQLFQKKQDIS
jgi:hypothetical protein